MRPHFAIPHARTRARGGQLMGRRGRIPKPRALRVLEGRRQHRALPIDTPQPRAGRPRCPRWLTADAKAYWRAVVPELERLRVLTVVDGGALAALCMSWARWQAAERFIAEHGERYEALQYVDDRGVAHTKIATRPEVYIAKDQKAALNRWSLEFGLTPAARMRVKVQPYGGAAAPDPDLNPVPKAAN
jgi:P27 family predicted phage terminase small subunit